MASQPLPKWLTRRKEAHRLVSWLQNLQIRYRAWQDTRRVNRAIKKRPARH